MTRYEKQEFPKERCLGRECICLTCENQEFKRGRLNPDNIFCSCMGDPAITQKECKKIFIKKLPIISESLQWK